MASLATRKHPKYVLIDGKPFAEIFSPKAVRSAMDYEPQDDDVIVSTYPKCGTTWMCQIILLIQSKGIPLTKDTYFQRQKFLELCGSGAVQRMSRPGCIKTHFRFEDLKFSPKCKYVCVARHPRDCVVSFYHHTKHFPIFRFMDGSFGDFFDLFIRGEVDFGGYFEHLKSWYEHRHEPNVYFTTYEAMKSDVRKIILEVAEFLEEGGSSSLLENDSRLLEDIVRYSSFEHMKVETNEFFKESFKKRMSDDLDEEDIEAAERILKSATDEGYRSVGEFVRNGTVGEGKLVLSEEQEKRLQEWILEKTRGTDVMGLWGDQ